MKKSLLVTLVLIANVFALSAYAEEGKAESSEKGANMQLFPAPKADPSRAARPGKPELTGPAYRAQVTGDGVTLKWNAVNSADAYHLQVATDPNFKWLVVNEERFKSNSYDLKGLQKSKHYFWRVAALKLNNMPTFMKGWFSLSTFETP